MNVNTSAQQDVVTNDSSRTDDSARPYNGPRTDDRKRRDGRIGIDTRGGIDIRAFRNAWRGDRWRMQQCRHARIGDVGIVMHEFGQYGRVSKFGRHDDCASARRGELRAMTGIGKKRDRVAVGALECAYPAHDHRPVTINDCADGSGQIG